MALFPTQKKTWDKLQKIKGHENDCGRPGVNGGYIKNPNVRFGINCFGPKPDQRPQDHAYMKSVSTPPYNKEQSEIDKRTILEKTNRPSLVTILMILGYIFLFFYSFFVILISFFFLSF